MVNRLNVEEENLVAREGGKSRVLRRRLNVGVTYASKYFPQVIWQKYLNLNKATIPVT